MASTSNFSGPKQVTIIKDDGSDLIRERLFADLPQVAAAGITYFVMENPRWKNQDIQAQFGWRFKQCNIVLKMLDGNSTDDAIRSCFMWGTARKVAVLSSDSGLATKLANPPKESKKEIKPPEESKPVILSSQQAKFNSTTKVFSIP